MQQYISILLISGCLRQSFVIIQPKSVPATCNNKKANWWNLEFSWRGVPLLRLSSVSWLRLFLLRSPHGVGRDWQCQYCILGHYPRSTHPCPPQIRFGQTTQYISQQIQSTRPRGFWRCGSPIPGRGFGLPYMTQFRAGIGLRIIIILRTA